MGKRASSSGSEMILHTDGASRGNPGLSGAGAVLFGPAGETIEELYRFLGEATNNEAEYRALILGLEAAIRHQPARLTIRLDSELIVRQLEGAYKVKNERLKPLFAEARRLLDQLPGSTIEHVGRSLNADADRLANRAIDEAT